MGQASSSPNQEKLEKALICMETALHLLDDADAPADIGAHLDLGISRLKAMRANSPMNVPVIAPNDQVRNRAVLQKALHHALVP